MCVCLLVYHIEGNVDRANRIYRRERKQLYDLRRLPVLEIESGVNFRFSPERYRKCARPAVSSLNNR